MQFTGLHAITQIQDRRPTFVVKQMQWDERTCRMIRLEPGKDTRDLPIDKRSFTAKEEYLVSTTTRVLAMSPPPMQYPIFTITPAQDLAPGEYLIAFNPSGAGAYEFGVEDGVKASD
jgi:hypothetical protein